MLRREAIGAKGSHWGVRWHWTYSRSHKAFLHEGCLRKYDHLPVSRSSFSGTISPANSFFVAPDEHWTPAWWGHVLPWHSLQIPKAPSTQPTARFPPKPRQQGKPCASANHGGPAFLLRALMRSFCHPNLPHHLRPSGPPLPPCSQQMPLLSAAEDDRKQGQWARVPSLPSANPVGGLSEPTPVTACLFLWILPPNASLAGLPHSPFPAIP